MHAHACICLHLGKIFRLPSPIFRLYAPLCGSFPACMYAPADPASRSRKHQAVRTRRLFASRPVCARSLQVSCHWIHSQCGSAVPLAALFGGDWMPSRCRPLNGAQGLPCVAQSQLCVDTLKHVEAGTSQPKRRK